MNKRKRLKDTIQGTNQKIEKKREPNCKTTVIQEVNDVLTNFAEIYSCIKVFSLSIVINLFWR